jgi:regulator of replication initiation timing
MSCEWCSTATKLRAENARLRAEGEEMDAEVANLTAERDHWKQARESAMAAGEVLKAENARLREALTRFDQLVEAAQTSHADDGYTDADVLVGKFQDELPALLALSATDQPKEAYQRGAADARAKLLAEVCAWLLEGATEPDLGDARDRLGRTDIIRLSADIEAKFKAILIG